MARAVPRCLYATRRTAVSASAPTSDATIRVSTTLLLLDDRAVVADDERLRAGEADAARPRRRAAELAGPRRPVVVVDRAVGAGHVDVVRRAAADRTDVRVVHLGR